MMKNISILVLVTLLLSSLICYGNDLSIGKVKTLQGEVVVIRNNKELSLIINDNIYQNDTLRTAINSSVGIIFIDDTVLSLGPQTELVVDEYVFSPEKGAMAMIIRMIKGTASYLSGIIGRQSPDSVKFQLPEASIAIRGTHFLVKVEG
jgi:hypothetical protein